MWVCLQGKDAGADANLYAGKAEKTDDADKDVEMGLGDTRHSKV